MSTSLRIAFALITLLTASACREIIDAPTDMGVAGDMPPPVDAGPCSPVCSGATPVCLVAEDGGVATCEECAIDDDCSGSDHCDPASHECVQCFDNSQCGTASLARCDLTAHTCAACDDNAQCSGFAATPACVVGEGCFECNRETRGLCNGGLGVCDATTHQCTDLPEHDQDLCEPCVSDDQCLVGQVCVPMTFGEAATSVGNFCLYRRAATGAGAPNGSCTTVRAYGVSRTYSNTVDGELDVDACSPIDDTTCVALADFRTRSCAGETVAGDAECGATGLDDAYCRAVDASTNQCTLPCGATTDCKVGATCNGTGRCVW